MANRSKSDKLRQPIRCTWARNDLAVAYHDQEWGMPLHRDRGLFEFLVLEGAQAGLSWDTILRKRDNYRAAFDDFDPVSWLATTRARCVGCFGTQAWSATV